MLTETLDSIPVDEDGLPSFEALADGDVTNASDRSCPSSPDGSPRTPEPEEPSLVRTAASSSRALFGHLVDQFSANGGCWGSSEANQRLRT